MKDTFSLSCNKTLYWNGAYMSLHSDLWPFEPRKYSFLTTVETHLRWITDSFMCMKIFLLVHKHYFWEWCLRKFVVASRCTVWKRNMSLTQCESRREAACDVKRLWSSQFCSQHDSVCVPYQPISSLSDVEKKRLFLWTLPCRFPHFHRWKP